MEERAAIRPSLPSPHPTASYWQDPKSALANHRTSSDLPSFVDVVIIGSGITGASVAYNLLTQDPKNSVLVLEARTACSGATGRNGGHTKPAAYREFLDNCKSLGEQEAAKIVKLQYRCVKEIHDFARKHSIKCDSWEGETVDIFYCQKQMKKAREAVLTMQKALGNDDPAARYTFYDSAETQSRFLAQGSLGSVSYAAGKLNAYLFGIGVLDMALKLGLNLQTETPAEKISCSSNGGPPWTVETPRGKITSRRIVVATNGYTARLLPQLQGILVPLRGTMTAHRPGRSLAGQRLSNTYSFIGMDGYEYLIPWLQGTGPPDIMIGGGLTKARDAGLYEYGTTDDGSVDPVILDYLERSTATYFGSNWGEDHPEGRLRKAWTGIMGYSADGLPFVGEIPNASGLLIAASFQGSGMVLSFMCAQALVNMLKGENDSALDSWFPQAFRMGLERLKHRFTGRLHTTAPMDLEVKSQG